LQVHTDCLHCLHRHGVTMSFARTALGLRAGLPYADRT
jgi:hypothetical protein